MSCTTGLHVVSSLRRSARRIRPMRSRSMTMWIGVCENGLQTPAIFTRHPKRELHEVHYARCVCALEDKIVQRATAAVLNAIYEEDFLGFSYGFRPQAQPARCAGCAGCWNHHHQGELDTRG